MPKRYYKDRAEAGKDLVNSLLQYVGEKCTVVALSEGGVIVGAQIAIRLNANLGILLTQQITLPGELDPISAISSSGAYTYNNMFSAGQLEDFKNEYHGYIEQQRVEKFRKLNQLVGDEGEISKESLNNHVVILVSDGINNGFSLDIASDFLKPVSPQRVIIATPFSSVSAYDDMRLLADEVVCFNRLENYISTSHYYEDNNIPNNQEIMKIIHNNNRNWSTDETLSHS